MNTNTTQYVNMNQNHAFNSHIEKKGRKENHKHIDIKFL